MPSHRWRGAAVNGVWALPARVRQSRAVEPEAPMRAAYGFRCDFSSPQNSPPATSFHSTRMSGNHFQNIEKLETSLWEAADQLRANSKLTSSEYCMPILGIIFLRHATNRYNDALKAIEADQAGKKMPKRQLVQADFLKRRALMLPKEVRYDEIRQLPKGSNLGDALIKAMGAIEASFEPLANHSSATLASSTMTCLKPCCGSS